MRRSTVLLFASFFIALIAGVGCGQHRTPSASAAADTTAMEGTQAPLERKGNATTFALKLKSGDRFDFRIETDERVKIGRDKEVEENRQKVTWWYAFTVLDAAEGGEARVEATCNRVLFAGEYKNTRGTQSLEFDSDKRYDERKLRDFAQYHAPVGTPFRFVIDREGRISDLSQLSGIIERFMGKDNYAKAKASAKETLAMDYGESGLKNVVQLAFQKFESRPIAVDSSWTIQWDGRQGYLALKHSARYTLKGYEQAGSERLAYVSVTMKSRYTGPDKVDSGQGIVTVQKFDVTGKGYSRIDPSQGLSRTRSFVQSMALRFLVEPPAELKQAAPDQAKDFVMTQDATITNTVTRISR